MQKAQLEKATKCTPALPLTLSLKKPPAVVSVVAFGIHLVKLVDRHVQVTCKALTATGKK
jgi:hypothetical protein